jgi:surface protein
LLGFEDPGSVIFANCTDTNFEDISRENCQCEISILTSPFGIPELCESCSFVAPANQEWRLEYDCSSNLVSGSCVGRDDSNTCISRLRFETTSDLRGAVDAYLTHNSEDSALALRYGWPIGVWDVSKIQDFCYLFSADEFDFADRFNPAAVTFNESILGWEVSSSATNMTSMFAGARSFDQPIGNWNVSSVTDMSFFFSFATSFDQPLGD